MASLANGKSGAASGPGLVTTHRQGRAMTESIHTKKLSGLPPAACPPFGNQMMFDEWIAKTLARISKS
jgi:hypothetical protein